LTEKFPPAPLKKVLLAESGSLLDLHIFNRSPHLFHLFLG